MCPLNSITNSQLLSPNFPKCILNPVCPNLKLKSISSPTPVRNLKNVIFSLESLVYKPIQLNQCNVCHKHFSTKGSLKVHSNIHLNIKPYKCNVCNKSFSQKSTLYQHFRIHTGEKPHSCNVCHRTNLSKHTCE